MEANLTSRDIELPPEVRRRIERKLNRLSRRLGNVIETKVELAEERTKSPEHRFIARINIDSGQTLLHGEERAESVLSAVDRVTRVIERQIEHQKGKLRDKGKGSPPPKTESSQPIEPIPNPRKVVKIKRFVLKPMSVTEAADQMELLGQISSCFIMLRTTD